MKGKASAKGQRGGPRKSPARGVKRVQIGPIISADMKRRLDREADASGRTISQVVEWRLEHGYAIDDTLRAMGRSFEGIDRENFEMEMRRRGYKPIHDARLGRLWAPPEAPLPSSGFIDRTEEEK